MSSGHEPRKQKARPRMKEGAQAFQLDFCQSCESRKRRSLMAVEGWGNPPHAALAEAELRLLLGGVFVKPVRRVGDNGMNAVDLTRFQPVKAIGVEERGFSDRDLRSPLSTILWRRLGRSSCRFSDAVAASRLSDEDIGRIQAQIRSNR